MRYKKGTFCTVPINQIKGIDPLAQAIYMWLCYHSNQEGTCFPGYDLLSAETGISKRTIIQKIDLLIEFGVLTKDKRRVGGKQSTNVYSIIILDQLQGEAESISLGEDASLGQGEAVALSGCISRTHIIDEPNSINQKSNTPADLKTLVEPYQEQYGQDMIEKFLRYWTQKNNGGKREHWQMQRVFDVPKRLAMWHEKEKSWNSARSGSSVVTCHDGSKAVMRGGRWVDAHDNNVTLDLAYYPELAKM